MRVEREKLWKKAGKDSYAHASGIAFKRVENNQLPPWKNEWHLCGESGATLLVVHLCDESTVMLNGAVKSQFFTYASDECPDAWTERPLQYVERQYHYRRGVYLVIRHNNEYPWYNSYEVMAQDGELRNGSPRLQSVLTIDRAASCVSLRDKREGHESFRF